MSLPASLEKKKSLFLTQPSHLHLKHVVCAGLGDLKLILGAIV